MSYLDLSIQLEELEAAIESNFLSEVGRIMEFANEVSNDNAIIAKLPQEIEIGDCYKITQIRSDFKLLIVNTNLGYTNIVILRQLTVEQRLQLIEQLEEIEEENSHLLPEFSFV